MEVSEEGRNVGLVNLGFLVATRIQAHFGAFAFIPQILHFVHGGHVFEFEKDELVVLAAIEPVERFAANEFAFVDQNGLLAVFSECGFQLGYEARLGIKPP